MTDTTQAIIPVATRQLDAFSFYPVWLAGQDSPKTKLAYDGSIRDFAEFTNASSTVRAVGAFLSVKEGEANAIADMYRTHLRDRELAPATVNLRLAALRQLCKDARRYGLIDWSLDVDSVKSQKLKDTRGCGDDGYQLILDAVMERHDDSKKWRDLAIIRLLHDLALRRNEVTGLDLEHVDRAGQRLSIMGKARSEREWVHLPKPTLAALLGWIKIRGEHPGPLFVNLDSSTKQGRLSGTSVWRIVNHYAGLKGVKARPHALRHNSISAAARLTGGDMVKVCAFARHSNMNTTKIYIDNLKDHAGGVADLVAGPVDPDQHDPEGVD